MALNLRILENYKQYEEQRLYSQSTTSSMMLFSCCCCCIPRKQKSLHPIPCEFTARLRDLACFSSLWPSVTVTKLTTRWEGSEKLPGEPAVMVLGSSNCRRCWLCHVSGTPSPKIHDQAHYFYHIINPQQSKAPRSMFVMNSYLPDGRSMAHLSFGHNENLLAQSKDTGDETWMILCDAKWK